MENVDKCWKQHYGAALYNIEHQTKCPDSRLSNQFVATINLIKVQQVAHWLSLVNFLTSYILH